MRLLVRVQRGGDGIQLQPSSCRWISQASHRDFANRGTSPASKGRLALQRSGLGLEATTSPRPHLGTASLKRVRYCGSKVVWRKVGRGLVSLMASDASMSAAAEEDVLPEMLQG